jgi:flagellin
MQGITGPTNSAANTMVNVFGRKSGEAANSMQEIATGSRLTRVSTDASSSAIVAKMDSTSQVLNQAVRNASIGASVVQTAAGAQQQILGVLTQMKTLSAQSNDGSQDETSRALIDTSFQALLKQIDKIASQARWNGASLLSGAAGAISAPANNTNTMSATGFGTLVANSFKTGPAPVNITKSNGFISGTFTGATVTANGANNMDIVVTMQNATVGGPVTQTFTATLNTAVAGQSLSLKSTSDPSNVLVLDYDALDVTGIATAANFQTALQSVLNIGAGKQGASVTSASSAFNAGVTGVTAASNTPAGAYALSFDSTSKVMSLSTGGQAFKVTMAAAGAQNVQFSNGITVALDSTFALGTAVTQSVFNVAAGAGAVAMNFQVAELSTDTITVNIAGSSAAALNIATLNVGSQLNAQTASTALDAAITAINTSIATLGSQQKQLEIAVNNLNTSLENTAAARGVASDANIPASMTDLTRSTVAAQLTQAMLSQSLELQKGLVRLAQ